jgi:fibronectin-binding autotransporter adhesin
MKLQTPHQRVSMPAKPLAFGLGIFLSAGALSLHASSQTWDGGASTNVLNTAANWTNDTTPGTALDNATFDGTAAGNLALIWNAAIGPSSGNAGGLNVILASTQTGSVQLDASGTSNFGLGDVTINSGAGAFTLGDGSGTTNVTLRDATQAFTNNSSNTATIKSDVVIANGGGAGSRTVIFDGSGNWTVEGSVFGSGTYTGATGALISKTGTGTLTLNGANVNTGITSITGGAIAITNGSALGTGSTNIYGTSAASSSVGAIENTSGNNTLSGAITWSNTGGLFTNIVSQSGTLTLSGNITTSGSVTGTRTLNLGGAGNITTTGVISDGVATLGLSKNGAGTVTLSGPNTYTGGTTINGGTLAVGVNNALPTGTAIAITSGTLDMGSFTSTATSLDISNTATLKFNMGSVAAGNSTALLALSGAFTETADGGSYVIDFGNSTFGSVGTYKLLSFSSVAGTFAANDFSVSNLASGVVGSLSLTGTNLSFIVTSISAVPEPSTYAALAGLVVLGLATMRRRKQV